MANCMFGWNNVISSGGITTSTAIVGMDGSNLQDDQGSTASAWQTTSTSANMTIDSGSSTTTWQTFGVFRTNMTPSMTMRARVSNDPAFGSSIYDSGTLGGLTKDFGQMIIAATSVQTGRYCRFDFSDPTNTDGFLNIPLAYAGPVWQMLTNPDFSTSFGRDDETDEITTRGGQEYPTNRYQRRRREVSLQGLRASEVWTQVDKLDRFSRTGGNVLMIPDPRGTDLQTETIFGRGKATADISWSAGASDRRSWKFRVTERL